MTEPVERNGHARTGFNPTHTTHTACFLAVALRNSVAAIAVDVRNRFP